MRTLSIKQTLLSILLITLLPITAVAATPKVTPTPIEAGQFIVLCYHAFSKDPIPGDPYTLTQGQFAEQLDYLNTHGYNPVSLQAILDAKAGRQPLPEKAVLLSFDDAYQSYYNFAMPLLKEYGFPSILAVVGSFIEQPPEKGLPQELMSWEEIRKANASPLVEVVSHTYNLHKGVQYNPIGNTGPAVNVRLYDPATEHYETEGEYITRLKADFSSQHRLFANRAGFQPRAIVWPYGMYNDIAAEVARNAGMQAGFTLEWGIGDSQASLYEVPRVMIESIPIQGFIQNVQYPKHKSTVFRAVQVDLDLLYDPSVEQMDKNLGKLVDRLYAMKVNRVYLQAFADPDGDGNVDSVYFHNRVLPVKSDFFSHAVHQLRIRGMEIYAWMPTLSYIFPDSEFNERNRVMEKKGDKLQASSSWYKRLTPFSPEVQERVRMLYEDLAAYSQIDGILFQDDAFLTDYEDFHPLAIEAYKQTFGPGFQPKNDRQDHDAALRWGAFKTNALINFTHTLTATVKRVRPDANFSRNLYAILLTNPQSEAWFAQNYRAFLNNYDEVVVMAYPQMEQASRTSRWLSQLVDTVRANQGLNKTIFKLQAYDWKQKRWVDSRALLEEMRDLLVAGGIHLAYYPDNALTNQPELATIKLEMSRQTFPFAR